MAQEAYFGSFLSTVMILGLAFYSIRFITRLLTKKTGPGASPNSDRNRTKGKGNGDDLGEYVDFEDVDDDK